MNTYERIDRDLSDRDFTVVGKSVKRSDTLEKVTGTARYAGDVALPGMLHAKMKRSNIAHARIRSIDTSKALALKGVKAVLTHEDVPRVLHAGSPHPRSASVTKDQYILDDRVRYWGEGVAAVAAVSEEIAERAVALIEVEYEPLPGLFTIEAASVPGAPPIHENGLDRNQVLPPVFVTRGDVDRGFAEADLILEREYDLGRPTPAYMEPNVCVSQWDGNGKLTMWTSTQSAFMVRGTLAEVLGVPLNKVRVIVDHMGGGFGAKQDLFQNEFLCALLARQTGRPVKMEFSRKETFLGGRSRHPGKIWLKQGFTKDGRIVAREARVTFNSGAYGSHGPGVTNVGTAALTSLYRCENVRLEGRCIYTNSPIAGAFRGYGVVQTYYALDLMMDEAAEKLGFDPAEFKLMNAVREGDIAPSGHPIVGHGLGDCIRRVMEETNWHELRRREKPETVKRRGIGIGCEMHGSSAYPGIKEQGNAIVKMNEDGTVTLITGTAGLGTGAHTALSQIVAEELGVPFEAVSVVQGDTDIVPWDIGAFASHTTYLGGRAAQLAAADVRRQVLEHAAPMLKAEPENLAIRDGFVVVTNGSNRSIRLSEAVGPQRGMPAVQLVGVGTYMPTKSYSFAAHFAEVEVDTETGEVAVLQVVPVHEIGRVIHPIAAAGQIEGGIQQGIGHTLSEDYVIDLTDGRSLNPSFVDYKMPLSMDMPSIRTIILETAPDPGGPYGAKGVGEDPIIAIGPAIANAIYDAIGVRFHHYPITPEQVLNALKSKANETRQ
ncbi:xanthine dehydrogenase family protein molybdopterin-binding subunit [Sinorhizobium meliloti]|uniref:Probable dehydrogenase n=1 Tax=Rhizobium meliloti (strain 1021) TaxID=266834 RepID=Q92X30_RHIME|nr:xanthine dehydrogenase family protein molybdopterin-binding subunit [Sinorhizobium meliloti]TWB01074.1 xanthine dehydrogenase molybdenum-binding subunit [Ensifer sp. SEMIA 134]TWB38356.1 xanthine dehydrogenase molybdenum-binding subunit [Ensifer sp. SEMIA 135]AGG71130.1 putative dehydrogenase [Sinorhizobium meliloti 2011]ASP61714.1 dehydrogenase [Sinorhizobium meliloti]ASP89040.1 dehydrogenase [Sinorhizobium meliloti]